MRVNLVSMVTDWSLPELSTNQSLLVLNDKHNSNMISYLYSDPAHQEMGLGTASLVLTLLCCCQAFIPNLLQLSVFPYLTNLCTLIPSFKKIP